jgi:two-component system LytT family sensor kinase
MLFKKSLFLLAVCLLLTTASRAQRITLFGRAPVRISGEGFLLPLMKTRVFQDDIGDCPKRKAAPIYLAGNSFEIQTTDLPFSNSLSISENFRQDTLYINHYKMYPMYTRSYTTKTPITGAQSLSELQKQSNEPKPYMLRDITDIKYLQMKINDFFFVDFHDYKTDTLVRRYYIKRVKVSPRIEGYYELPDQVQSKENKLVKIGKQNEIALAPDHRIRLFLSTETGLPDSLVQYSLVNLKTGDTLQRTTSKQLLLPALKANTDYSLQLYYKPQPESVVVYYLKIKPYWYQSSLFYLIAGGLVFILVTSISVVSLRRKIQAKSREQQETEQRIRLLQSQLNPHFTFNSLSSIQGLINVNQTDKANYYLESFGNLLRKTLERSQHIYNTLDREIDMMKTYLSLEELRFNFQWNITVDSSFNAAEIEVPTLLLQPLIENAVKHGISGLGDEGQLSITCSNDHNDLIIIIKDNGAGFDGTARQGFGIRLTNDRIAAINKLEKEKSIQLTYEKNAGTVVILTFKNWIES